MQELATKETIRVDSSGNNTKVCIMKAQRVMSGKYILKAENKHGEDQVEMNVTVLGEFRTTKEMLLWVNVHLISARNI